MKKIFNFRPFLFFALFMCVGIILSTRFYSALINNFSFYALLGLIGLTLIYMILLIIVFRKVWEVRVLVKRIILCVIACLIGISTVSLNNAVINKSSINNDFYCVFGRVSSIPNNFEEQYLQSIILDDVFLIDNNDNKISLNGKVKAYFENDYSNSLLGIGNYIKFNAKIKSLNLKNENEINRDYSYLSHKIYFTADAKSEIEIIDKFKVNVFEDLKIDAKEILDNNLSEKYSAIGYGMLFGEDNFIDSKISSVYKDSGIAHLLAVSGLHIGFVVLLLTGLFSLCKVNDRVSSIVIILILLMYVCICNGATSVVRAFIMASCMLLAKLFYRNYDGLSALSFSAIIILLFSPLQLFSVGMQLSFMSVLSILLINRGLTKFFSRFLFEKVSSGFAMSMSASIGVMPVMGIYFGKISILSIFTNFLIIPIASVAFMLLFLSMVVSLIVPSISVIVLPFEYIMRFVTAVASISQMISINVINVKFVSSVLVFVVGILFVSSEYIKLKKITKLIIITLLLIFAVFVCVLL